MSRTPYRIGLALFVTPLLSGLLESYLASFIPGYEGQRLVYGKVGDLLLVTSLVVLGGEFWDKLKRLFVYGAKTHFPST